MSIVITLVVAAVLVGTAVAGWVRYEKRKLRASFGPEFENVAREHETPRKVDRELRRRKKMHDNLSVREISEDERQYFTASWESLQGGFIDSPAVSLASAENLVAKVLDAKGYPGADSDEHHALLSVEHAQPLVDYRAAQQISRHAQADPDSTSTEEMRQALVLYHTLFNELLANPEAAGSR